MEWAWRNLPQASENVKVHASTAAWKVLTATGALEHKPILPKQQKKLKNLFSKLIQYFV